MNNEKLRADMLNRCFVALEGDYRQDVTILNTEVEALRGELATLLQHTLEVLEPWADVKPRDWKTDREKLWRLHDDIKALATHRAAQGENHD